MPQPIDMNTELGRMTAAEKIQQIADRASLAAQHRIDGEADNDRVESETTISETRESQGEQVEADGKRKNPFAGRRRHRTVLPDDEVDEEFATDDGEEGRHFDVSI